jgi:hypothetical protein
LVPALGWLALRHRHVQAAPTEADAAWNHLVAFEALRRSKVDFAKLATWDRMSGPDPYVVRRLPDSAQLVGILRGSDAVVVLDRSLREVQRLAAPAGPVALAVADDGMVFVAGELSTTLARYLWKDGVLVPAGTWELEGVRAIRDIATGPGGFVYAVEEHEGRLLALRIERAKGADRPILFYQIKVGNGPIRLERVGNVLIADCLLDHALVVLKLEPSGALGADPPIRIVHDGPIWSFAARPLGADGNTLLIAAGGVEDHPLDRTIGAFGYIDSFLYLYRVDVFRGSATREAAINLSELGVVTPKAIALETSPAVIVTATGYASDRLIRLEFEPDRSRAPRLNTAAFVPGAASVATLADGELAFADPLLDAWVRQPLRRASNDEGQETDVVSVPAREPEATRKSASAKRFSSPR